MAHPDDPSDFQVNWPTRAPFIGRSTITNAKLLAEPTIQSIPATGVLAPRATSVVASCWFAPTRQEHSLSVVSLLGRSVGPKPRGRYAVWARWVNRDQFMLFVNGNEGAATYISLVEHPARMECVVELCPELPWRLRRPEAPASRLGFLYLLEGVQPTHRSFYRRLFAASAALCANSFVMSTTSSVFSLVASTAFSAISLVACTALPRASLAASAALTAAS